MPPLPTLWGEWRQLIQRIRWTSAKNLSKVRRDLVSLRKRGYLGWGGYAGELGRLRLRKLLVK